MYYVCTTTTSAWRKKGPVPFLMQKELLVLHNSVSRTMTLPAYSFILLFFCRGTKHPQTVLRQRWAPCKSRAGTADVSCVYLERKKAFMQLRTGRFMYSCATSHPSSVLTRTCSPDTDIQMQGVENAARHSISCEKNIPLSGKSKHPRGKDFRLGKSLIIFSENVAVTECSPGYHEIIAEVAAAGKDSPFHCFPFSQILRPFPPTIQSRDRERSIEGNVHLEGIHPSF